MSTDLDPTASGRMVERMLGELRAKRDAAQALAESAPDLLWALKRLSAQCERLRLPGQPESDAEKNARAVIARAEAA